MSARVAATQAPWVCGAVLVGVELGVRLGVGVGEAPDGVTTGDGVLTPNEDEP